MQRFQDVETRTPVILTTSQLLTTGLDAPTCHELDADGKQLRVVKLTDYTTSQLLTTGRQPIPIAAEDVFVVGHGIRVVAHVRPAR